MKARVSFALDLRAIAIEIWSLRVTTSHLSVSLARPLFIDVKTS